ncbi:hypothetical protein TSH58p_22625 (plasmid) [Azospirillum sp. TSH58]|uniref:Uncharacterized protein n=1 Tax=Azospirillum brasilense TaxID=192 RepID=A0A560CQK7_AZOBR|nr:MULTISPECIES: hypothetical protein [Azospirillum]AWJ86315.1 hypothetical protein TSH58p_22625 [Azospirillum sp. TSH58]MBK3735692.1 hypothetical protein [Azospirillum brasilense]PWC73434.1 hypothetical protein TSH58_04490 [Azospirillum sp. TSH58]TWA87142.1 hypothetical protein FBZ83_1014 [Azospirillum brasilense]
MKLPHVVALAAIGTGLPAAVALADDPTVNGLIGSTIQALTGAHPSVQAAAILSAAGLLGWRMWLNRPQPASHSIDEVFALLNSLSERLDGLQQRMDTHIDQHDRRVA